MPITNPVQPVVDMLRNVFTSTDDGQRVNAVDGLFAIADGLQAVATSIHDLGMGANAYDFSGKHWGGLESLSFEIKEGFAALATALAEAKAE